MSKTNKIGLRRLKKIANHLLTGKLGHKTFDFSVYNSNLKNGGYVCTNNDCGTNGCAIGELPIIFPKEWKFDNNSRYNISHKKDKTISDFLYLDGYIYSALFVPCSYYTEDYEWATYLKNNATKEQVANNILSYIKYVENENK